MQKSKPKICMFTQQNHRGLNGPILRTLWLMTSAAADAISVPGVRYTITHKSFLGDGVGGTYHWNVNVAILMKSVNK